MPLRTTRMVAGSPLQESGSAAAAAFVGGAGGAGPPAAAPAAPEELEIHEPATGRLARRKAVTPAAALPGILERARHAQAAWARESFRARARALRQVARVLYENGDELAELLHRSNGKPVAEALMAEVYPTAANFRWCARMAPRHLRPRRVRLASLPLAYSRLLYEPLGVVGVIAPWNYPLLLSLFDAPAALMAGNSVVVKVSEHAAAAGEAIEDLLRRARLPEDLVQVVYGYGDLGAALIEAGVDKVCFIGSTRVGRLVYQAAARRMIPCTLELGGKDAALVLEDADLDDAVAGILWAGLANCGQSCASVEVAYVPAALREGFAARLRAALAALPEESLGTMNVLFQKRMVLEQLRDARERGARVLAEGKVEGDNPFRLAPVVLADVPGGALVLREETFGPVLVVRGYGDLEAALREINAGDYGLTASVWTRDRRRGQELAARIDAGTVTINEHMITPGMPEAPWAGRRASGLGVSHSILSFASYCKVKYVFHDRGIVRYKFWRFPYTGDKLRWFRRFLSAQLAPRPWVRLRSMLAAAPRLLLRRDPPLGGRR